MNEYIIKYRIGTDWHEPHNTTTWNDNTEIINADSAKKATQNLLSSYNNILRSPNKSFEILSVKKI